MNRLPTQNKPPQTTLRGPAHSRRRVRLVQAALIWCLAAAAAGPAPAADVKQNSAGSAARDTVAAAEAALARPQIAYDSGGRRDPFLNPASQRQKAGKLNDEEADRGPAPPGIAGTYIAQAVLHGISLRDGGRLAVVRAADKRAYFLREGDRLFDGYLKKIDIDSITLVRETKVRSGRIETQDVIKRLRTP